MTRDTTFQSLVGVIGPYSSDLTIDWKFFEQLIQELCGQYAIDLLDPDEAYSTLRFALPALGAEYRKDTSVVDKKTLIRKLESLAQSANRTSQLIAEFSDREGRV